MLNVIEEFYRVRFESTAISDNYFEFESQKISEKDKHIAERSFFSPDNIRTIEMYVEAIQRKCDHLGAVGKFPDSSFVEQ